jgi:hypothetical protein
MRQGSVWRAILVLLLLAAFGRAAPLAAQGCAGDCGSDGRVTVDELVTVVGVTLGNVDAFTCPAADVDASGAVSVGEVVVAVAAALGGCRRFPSAGSEAVEVATGATLSSTGSLTVLNFGSAGASGRAAAAGGPGWRFARTLRPWLDDDAEGGGAGVVRCALGGTLEVESVVADGTCRRTTTYRQCREPSRNGTNVERDGVVTETVDDALFCQDPDRGRARRLTLDFDAFVESELTGAGALLARRTLTARSQRVAADEPGCAGPSFDEGRETIDGLVRFECDPDRNESCSQAIADVVLRARGLTLQRRFEVEAEGSTFPLCQLRMQVDGQLAEENRRRGEQFTIDYRGFIVRERALAGGDSLVSQEGVLDIDCVGPVRFTTDRRLRLPAGESCPSAGDLQVALGAGAVLAQSAALGSGSAAEAGGGSAAGSGLVNLLFRSSNGQVYQVLQNPEGNPNNATEDVRITTLVGTSLVAPLDGTRACASGGTPLDAVVAALGEPVGATSVFTSELIASGFPPCFNPNAAGGDGAVCIGRGCSADCGCAGECQDFTIADGLAPGAAGTIPRLTLVPSLAAANAGCAIATQGLATYAFGTAQPAITRDLCADPPLDGFTLRGANAGASLIVAYDVPFGQGFDAGAAGFTVDVDGDHPRCDGTNQVINGVALSEQLAAPRVSFGATQFVQFDFNSDGFFDKSVPSCEEIAAARCGTRPTPTPTAGFPPPCPEQEIGNAQQGSTRGQPNRLAGATCGDGGKSAPERAYGFRAPSAGVYVIDTLQTNGLAEPYDTLLYVRRGSDCDRGVELACNDNVAGDVLQSQVAVPLQSGEQVTIVVDGSAGRSGDFHLRIRRFDQAPTSTPTPTRTPGPGPDLIVASVSAPANARTGDSIAVAAMVRNAGEIAAGEFNVGFVFATDADLTRDRIEAGAECTVSSLAPQGAAPCALDVLVPVGLRSGTYFVGAVADIGAEVVESDETNNEAASDPITIQGNETPTVTPTPRPPGCRPDFLGCTGSCPNRNESCLRIGSICTCIDLFSTPTPTATPTRRSCGNSFPLCNGSCPFVFQICESSGRGCACSSIIDPGLP